jgi:hypothetical protein
MQRRNSLKLAAGSVHGIACALSYFRGGQNELDTHLLWLATPNWFSSSARMFRREEKKQIASVVRRPSPQV